MTPRVGSVKLRGCAIWDAHLTLTPGFGAALTKQEEYDQRLHEARSVLAHLDEQIEHYQALVGRVVPLARAKRVRATITAYPPAALNRRVCSRPVSLERARQQLGGMMQQRASTEEQQRYRAQVTKMAKNLVTAGYTARSIELASTVSNAANTGYKAGYEAGVRAGVEAAYRASVAARTSPHVEGKMALDEAEALNAHPASRLPTKAICVNCNGSRLNDHAAKRANSHTMASGARDRTHLSDASVQGAT